MFKSLSLVALVFALQSCGVQNEGSLYTEQPNTDYQIKKLEDGFQASRQGADVAAKLEGASAFFLGTPYGNGLGEGEIPNTLYRGPLYRGDSFNCTTLIETVLAMANASSFEDFKTVINIVRYKNGEVGFLNRNHFPDADWIKNNQELGFFQDYTSAIATQAVVALKESTANIDRQTWFREFWETETNFQAEDVKLPYIAIVDLFKQGEELNKLVSEYTIRENEFIARIRAEKDVAKQLAIRDEWHTYVVGLDLSQVTNERLVATIPSGSIVNLVTPGWQLKKGEKIVTGMNIGHQALIFKDQQNHAHVRDASLTFKRVIDTPLANYFFIKLTSSTQKGVNFLKPGTSKISK